MLKGMRDNANSFIITILFGIIIIVFVFSFGPGSAKYCGSPIPVAIHVDGHAISQAEFQQQYSRSFSRMQRMRSKYTTDTARKENLKKIVADQLISRELLVQEAMRRGIVITDKELADQIVKIPVFQQDGKFDRDLYRRYATSMNLSESAFEEQFRRDLLSQRMRDILTDSVVVSPNEVRKTWENRNNRADLWVVKIDPLHFLNQVQITDEEVAAYAKDQRAKIEDRYNKDNKRYNKGERVRARQILIKVAKDADAATLAKARERIDAAKARIDKGEDFAKVAKELSEDPSASQGGDLGAQPRGTWVKEFEDAAFALKAGQVSDVIKTQEGFHIIKAEAKIPASTQTIDEVAKDIAKQLLTEERSTALAQAAAKDWQSKLCATEDPQTLNPPADDSVKPDPFAPKVEITGKFQMDARYIPKVGIAAELVEKAFTLTMDKPCPEAPVESSKRYFAIKLRARDLPNEDDFAKDKQNIAMEIGSRRGASVVEDFVKQARAKASVTLNPSLTSYRDPNS